MRDTQYLIHAFTQRPLKGNPAMVCPLTSWLADSDMQHIAYINNVSETAFFVPDKNGFNLRWFTPTQEIALCGHATLASAYVIFNLLGYTQSAIIFYTLSGELTVWKEGNKLIMDFPAAHPITAVTDLEKNTISNILNTPCLSVFKDIDQNMIALLSSEHAVQQLTPNITLLGQQQVRMLIVTAHSTDTSIDFVSRVFAPKLGIAEDPVTGFAHTLLAPFWAEKLSKHQLRAKQLSRCGGYLELTVLNTPRILIAGFATHTIPSLCS